MEQRVGDVGRNRDGGKTGVSQAFTWRQASRNTHSSMERMSPVSIAAFKKTPAAPGRAWDVSIAPTLQPQDFSGVDVELRLIEDDELFPLQGATQFIFQVQAIGRRGVEPDE